MTMSFFRTEISTRTFYGIHPPEGHTQFGTPPRRMDPVERPGGNLRPDVLRDPSAGGAYSIWYSTPVALGAGDAMLSGAPDYSSLFHEMGHNFTLNFPGNYFFGGKIDGNANAIYSESMAQIFQHSCGFEIVNGYEAYGLSNDLVFDIKQSLISSIGVVRKGYEDYLGG